MSESWDDYADGWDSDESVVLYSRKAFQALLDVTEIEGVRVLDFGCGTGLLTELVSRHASSVVAIDPSEKMMAVLTGKRLENVSAITSELTQKLVDEHEKLRGGFDLIVASSALSFVPNYRETLRLLIQLLNEAATRQNSITHCSP